LHYIPHIFIIDPKGKLYWHGEPNHRPHRLLKLWTKLDEAVKKAVAETIPKEPAKKPKED